jgi:hypothetical protein
MLSMIVKGVVQLSGFVRSQADIDSPGTAS